MEKITLSIPTISCEHCEPLKENWGKYKELKKWKETPQQRKSPCNGIYQRRWRKSSPP